MVGAQIRSAPLAQPGPAGICASGPWDRRPALTLGGDIKGKQKASPGSWQSKHICVSASLLKLMLMPHVCGSVCVAQLVMSRHSNPLSHSQRPRAPSWSSNVDGRMSPAGGRDALFLPRTPALNTGQGDMWDQSVMNGAGGARDLPA